MKSKLYGVLSLFLTVIILLTSCAAPVFDDSSAESVESYSSTSFEQSESEKSELPEESKPAEESTQPQPEEEPKVDFNGINLNAAYAFAYDTKADQIYFIKGRAKDKVYPASVTKLYTAYVALKYLKPDDVITAGDELSQVGPDSSVAYIGNGFKLTAEMLIEGMMLPSGNDAAYVLAAGAGRVMANNPKLSGGLAVLAFVDEMNYQAKRDGLAGTHFVTPDGYHRDDHYTCPEDLIKIAQLALGEEIITKYTSKPYDKVRYASGQTNTWYNSNKFIDPDSSYYRREVIGLKTGTTTPAGYCLLTAARYKDRDIIVGTFKCSSSSSRYSDTARILNLMIRTLKLEKAN